jgi:hypothetical protein
MRHSFWLLAALVGVASVCLAAPALAGASTFSNSGAITIPDFGTATPYPSTISVSGLSGTISDVNVTLTGFSHTSPLDVDILVVGPTGASAELFDGAGGGSPVSNLNFTFDDGAASMLPCSSTAMSSGSYQPTDCFPLDLGVDVFPPPAPAGPWDQLLSAFNGTDPNGTWSLYVVDQLPGVSGSISGGWSLDITAAGETPEQKLGDLQDLVAGMGIQLGITNALKSKLQNALDALAADDSAGACFWTQSFLDLVTAQTGKKISSGQAQQLTDAANEIRADLAC